MAAVLTGQIALSGSAQVLSTPANVTGFVVKAPASNLHPAFIGPSTVTTSTGHQLDPGDDFAFERRVASGQPIYQIGPGDVYAVGTSGDVVTWLAFP